MISETSTLLKKGMSVISTNPFYRIIEIVPNAIESAFNLIQSRWIYLSNLVKEAFDLVIYGLSITRSILRIALFSLSIIAAYQTFWAQVNHQDYLKDGGAVAIGKHYYFTVS